MNIQGACATPFRTVREEFERNFAERGEVGASVCVVVGGEAVVDLWGGLAERRAGVPWERNTLSLVWSCTKGAVALCAHVLHARGLLNYDAPVARYWPQFAQAGKEDITVRLVLSHQAALPVFRTPLRPGALYDWNYLVSVLAAEAPSWPPGTRQGYHAATFGHLVGELVRRISGKDLGRFFRDEVAGPLGLDFHIGLPPQDERRVAPTVPPDIAPAGEAPSRFLSALAADPHGLQALMVKNTGRNPLPRDHDSPAAHQAQLPSQGGITNARGLAGLYAPLAEGGGRLVDADTLVEMQTVHSASAVDAVLLVGLRFGLGFMKSSDNRRGPPGARDSVLLSEAAFGHAGMGGSIGFADPIAQLAFGYTMNKQGRGVLLNERGQALVDAFYRSLGYRTDAPGRWV
jgi:CubicO group peptidase (beta-lactamase class C family)